MSRFEKLPADIICPSCKEPMASGYPCPNAFCPTNNSQIAALKVGIAEKTEEARIMREKMKRNSEYWTPEDFAALEKAQSFSELSKIAMRVLSRMPQPIGQVCGPISTGGKQSIPENLKVFDATIQNLIDTGKTIFDQMPFEEHFFRIIDEGWDTKHNNKLLTDFYLPILESGRIKTLYFMRDWQTSKGATWEHEQAQRLGIEIVYL